jgi:hypothetical protein
LVSVRGHTRGFIGSGDADALRSVFERHVNERDGVRSAKRRPVGGEVGALESLPADLFGEQSVDDGVIDVLEKMAVDVLVDRPHRPIGVDDEDGDPRFRGAARHGPACGEGNAGGNGQGMR